MSNIQKSSLTVDGNAVHLSMPITKVDKANRLVSGYATLDNIDSEGDVVLAEASSKAFARARGNLREMHQPIAVGKIIDFQENEYFDTTEGQLYRGIYVTARVSEGAEDTWKKVLDETLTGFSIGGEIVEASNEFVKEAGRTIRFIKDYNLVELSLVDNPANQLANVLSIQKSATGSVTVQGMVADTVIENVFICKTDQTVIVKGSESENCPMCGTKMENAGWFEAGERRAEKVKDIVSKFLSPTETEAAPNASSEGGVDMGTEVTKSETSEESNSFGETQQTEENKENEQTVKDETSAEVNETAGTEGAPVEVASPDEVEDDDTNISKKIDALHTAVKDSLEKTRTETDEQVKGLESKIEEMHKSFETKASELESKLDSFGEKLETTKGRLADFEASLEKMNSSEAFKKSADLEESTEPVQKTKTTVWNGAFSVKDLL